VTARGRIQEQGVVLLWAIIALAVMAVIAITLTMAANGLLERSGTKSERVATYPQVQSAVTKLGVALQSQLASPGDDYALSPADLAKLSKGGASNVASSAQMPKQYQDQGGIWQRAGASLVSVGALPVTAYHERVSLTPAQCTEFGVSPCSNVHGWWQVYRVEKPDTTATSEVSQLVYYVRTWIAPPPPSASAPPKTSSDPIVVRISARPGRFADYQLISDGTVSFRPGATIDGPVHSNGFDTDDAATGGASTPYAISVPGGVSCGPDGSLTSARKTISAAGSSDCPAQANTNRYITFLRVQTQIDDIHDDYAAHRAGVREYAAAYDSAYADPFDTAYHVKLEGSSYRVKPPGGSWSGSISPGEGEGAVLFRDDVIVEGDLRQRFTIAASRSSGGAASIYILDDINDDVTEKGKTLGLIAQGNVIVAMGRKAGAGDCNVKTVRAAIVAAAGGLTIPPEYATQQSQQGAPHCNGTIRIDGSIAAHRSPMLNWTWADGTWAGYTGRYYKHDRRLINATPPYFPLTGNWQATSVREANADCYAPGGARIKEADCA
jgi:hypothetical protein